MGDTFSPVNVLEEGAGEAKGEQARMASIMGALAVADLVKSSLGPKGMDKILQSTGRGGSVSVRLRPHSQPMPPSPPAALSPATPYSPQVTNDGATILKSVLIDNPAAKVLIDISKVQDDEVGDGTTSVCVLAGEFLRQAQELIEKKIHPQTIVRGYRLAREAALASLAKAKMDNTKDEKAFRQDLLNIAKTTLSSKVLSQDKEMFAEIAVSAVLKLKGTSGTADGAPPSPAGAKTSTKGADTSSLNLDLIQIIKKEGGTLRDSYLDNDGFLLNKTIGVGCPKRMTDCKVCPRRSPYTPTPIAPRCRRLPLAPPLTPSPSPSSSPGAHRQHADGHRQGEDLRLEDQGGLGGEGRRDRKR